MRKKNVETANNNKTNLKWQVTSVQLSLSLRLVFGKSIVQKTNCRKRTDNWSEVSCCSFVVYVCGFFWIFCANSKTKHFASLDKNFQNHEMKRSTDMMWSGFREHLLQFFYIGDFTNGITFCEFEVMDAIDFSFVGLIIVFQFRDTFLVLQFLSCSTAIWLWPV